MYLNQTEQSSCFDPNTIILQQQFSSSDHHHHHHHHHQSSIVDDQLDLHTQNPLLNQMPAFPHFHENHNSITDLLTTLQLPNSNHKSSSSPSSSSMGFLGLPDFSNTDDPLFHLNQPSSLRDLLLQQGYSDQGVIQQEHHINNVLGFDRNNGYDHYNHHQNQNQNHHDGVFEFNSGNPCMSEGKEGKGPKNFVTERQRRQNFSDKYQHLKSLVPNPTKGDRASIVKDAIDYIMELKRTVAELKLLVEKKRVTKERHKRLKNHDDNSSINAGKDDHQIRSLDGPPVLVKPDPDQDFDGFGSTQLRSSWLQRKCKDTEVDVRIVDDEVTIKLVQRKKINCLLSVSRTLDELQLDLRHVAGGHVGDYYSYLFNSKICEGSLVYASSIANKLIEVVERQYASASVALQPTSSY